MNRLQEEFLFLVRTSFHARQTPHEALDVLRRHLAFRNEGEADRDPPRLRLVYVAPD